MCSRLEKVVSLATSLLAEGLAEDCARLCRAAIGCGLDHGHLHYLAGSSLVQLRLPDQAGDHVLRAVEWAPEDADVLTTYAGWLGQTGRYNQCISIADRLILADSANCAARYNRGMARLALGDWGGWEDYEARILLGLASNPLPGSPRWQGEALADGARLLIMSDQGFGDTIMFARWIAAAKAASGAIVTLAVRPELSPVLEGLAAAGGFMLASEDVSAEQFDYWCCISSLPYLTRSYTPENIPYITYDRKARGGRQALLGSGRHAGYILKGSGRTPGNDISISEWELAVSSLKGITWHDLTCRDSILHFGHVAEIMAGCEFVVSIDTAGAHLAGAMGVPTHLMVPYHAEWRWGTDPFTTALYRSVRLHRQGEHGNWRAPLSRMAAMVRGE